MDLLYWNNLNPGVESQKTSKQFFGRFLWRLIIHADGGRLIDSAEANLSSALTTRINLHSHIRGLWRGDRNGSLSNVNIGLLEEIRNIKTAYGNSIRVRVEEPNIQFYAEDETTLKAIADRLPDKNCIEKVSGPADSAQEQLLKSDVILKKTDIGYKYKVVLKDGRYSIATKGQILNYLLSLGEDVKVSKGSQKMLDSKYSHIWGVFFYTNDPSIVTFITLIEPTIVAKIHELVLVSK